MRGRPRGSWVACAFEAALAVAAAFGSGRFLDLQAVAGRGGGGGAVVAAAIWRRARSTEAHMAHKVRTRRVAARRLAALCSLMAAVCRRSIHSSRQRARMGLRARRVQYPRSRAVIRVLAVTAASRRDGGHNSLAIPARCSDDGAYRRVRRAAHGGVTAWIAWAARLAAMAASRHATVVRAAGVAAKCTRRGSGGDRLRRWRATERATTVASRIRGGRDGGVWARRGEACTTGGGARAVMRVPRAACTPVNSS